MRLARLRDARALFADDVVAAIFVRVVGDEHALERFNAAVSAGVTAFVRFANPALGEYLARRQAEGLAIEDVPQADVE
jgi:hypothetical protein